MNQENKNINIINENPEDWLELYGDYLYRFALLRVKDSIAAEDLVQDCLLAGIKNLSSFSRKSTVKTWLTSILKHKILDYYRSSSKSKDTSKEELTKVVEKHFNKLDIWNVILEDWASNPELFLKNKQFHKTLEDCMNKLSQNAKRVFVLKVIDELPSEEVCKVLDLTPSNLWVLLHRSKMALRDCIELNWIKA